MRLLFASLLATLLITTSSIQAQQSQLGYEHVVPEKCWAMSAWNSAKQYDQQIDNPTVRLMSDPEIRAFVNDFHKRVGLIAPALVTSDQ